jgi:hypothetical protein
MTRLAGRVLLSTAVLLCCACSPRYLIVQGVASELASQRTDAEDDLVLAREASAFYLKLSESLLIQVPDNASLAAAVAGGFTQYAYAFVQHEAERIESRDAKAAQKLRERARRLYHRAEHHAMACLEQRTPGFAKALASANASDWPPIQPDQVPVAYWAAASWASVIALSKDNPEVVADLPLVVRLAKILWQTQPDFNEGALASLMGSLESVRPGGSVQDAMRYFDQAIAMGGGKSAAAFVSKAEGIALVSGDRTAFEALLRQALIASKWPRNLQNAVMGERAQWLLDTAEDLF